ncbi:MAG: class I SAM-dependent methyltransferase [Nevskia sp.]|nr:class I SAM-dependent methyltransferase [Nevskia sp.]
MAKTASQALHPIAPDREARGCSFALEEHGDRLELRALHRRNYGAICADWNGDELRRRIAAGRRQPLARAAGLHKGQALHLLDANAGLGRDGYTLAAFGAAVSLVERNPAVAALLRNAHERAFADAQTRAVAQRIDIIEAEARAVFASGCHWDVVYLDPMYPDDGKSALPAKEMQILRDLTGGDEDADQLLEPALACARQRVVVKRAPKAPWLAGMEPSMSLRSTQLRFDVYLKTAIRIARPAHDFHIP